MWCKDSNKRAANASDARSKWCYTTKANGCRKGYTDHCDGYKTCDNDSCEADRVRDRDHLVEFRIA
jgi:hypothetical protein